MTMTTAQIWGVHSNSIRGEQVIFRPLKDACEWSGNECISCLCRFIRCFDGFSSLTLPQHSGVGLFDSSPVGLGALQVLLCFRKAL